MSRKTLVSIIVVNYNGKKLLEDCFNSLFNLNYPKTRYEVIMVDNCSEDDSVDFVKDKFPKVKIIKNDVNNYCKANNLGIKAGQGEYIVLLNNDVKVDKNWLIELVKVIKKDDKIGAVCSKVLYPNDTIQNAGLVPLPNYYWDERGAGKDGKDYTEVEQVSSISNVSSLYRKECFEKIGLLDEDFMMYGEDVDLSLRLKKAGYKLLFVPKAIVYHKFHGTATEGLSQFYIERNRLLFIAKHYPDKLDNALLGRGYFTSNKTIDNTGKMYSVVTEILYKLLKHHNPDSVKGVIDSTLKELGKIVNYENKILNKKLFEGHKKLLKSKQILNRREVELTRVRKDVKKKDNKLKDYKKELQNLYKELKKRLDEVLIKEGQLLDREKELNQTYKELEIYKKESQNLSNHLKKKLDEVLIKDGELLKKGRQLEELRIEKDRQLKELRIEKDRQLKELRIEKDRQVEELRSNLDSIYNSKGYRFILQPLWIIIGITRKFLSFILKKLLSLIWRIFAILISPLFIIQSLLFYIESLIWSILSKKTIKIKKREVVPYEDLKVSVVIPNFNGLEYVKQCLPALFEADGFKNGENEVLVVDDGSSDGSVKYIKKNFPQVKLLQNKKNRKFGFTCNKGVREAENELIVLLNNDVIVTERFLKPLKEHFKNEEVFAVSPKSYGWDRETFNFGMHMGRFENGYVRFWNECETGNEKEIYQTSPSLIAVGGAMAFRKRDFLWLGGFDSIYKPNSWEDIDISYRAWKRGLKVLYEPKSIIYHKDAGTVTYERHKEIKNELLFTWKNIIDSKILNKHLNLLPWYLACGRLTFLKGLLWALEYLPKALMHRFNERRYLKIKDNVILNGCMKYYRNFERRKFKPLKSKPKRWILLVTPFIPYPLKMGGKIRIYTLAKFLKEKYNIILLSLVDYQEESKFIPDLKNIFSKVYTVYPKSPLKLLFPSRYRFAYSENLIGQLIQIQKEYPLDLIHIESNELLYLTQYAKHVPIVYTEHDISLMFFVGSYYKHKKLLLVKEFYDYLKRVNFHNHYYKKIDKVISLSKKDTQIIQSFFPDKDISYIPTGTDIDYFGFGYPGNKQKRIIYIGHYSHYPNQEAVVYFVNKVFPNIRNQIPEVEFLIVGSNPTQAIKNLSWIPGVTLIGEVDEVKPYLLKAAVFVNPTRISAGIKGKVLEAMACGVPVVSTTRGIWGLEVEPGEEILIADSPLEFANQVVNLLQNDNLHYKIATNARKLVEDKYDWKKIAFYLDNAYKDAISKYDLLGPEFSSENVKKNTSFHHFNYPVSQFLKKSKLPVKFDNNLSSIIHRVKNHLDSVIEETPISGPEMGPEELHLELTYRCQSRCVMCDLWDYERRLEVKPKELNLDEIKNFIQQSSYLKRIKSIVLTGGEPFLRSDLIEICNSLISNFPKAWVNILTSAIDTENVIKKTKRILTECKPSQLWLSTSIDGIGKVHDKIRNHEGGFDKVVETLEQCRKHFPGVKLSATFTITPYNTDQLLEVRRFCLKKNIDFFAQFAIQKQPRDRLIWTNEHFQEVEKSVNLIIEELIDGRSYEQIEHNPDLLAKLYYWSHFVQYQTTPQRFFKKCVAGSRFAMFTPYGDLFFCPILKNKTIGNIGQEKFDKMWMSKKADELRDYINEGRCHCWLLCAVYPILKQVLDRSKKVAEKEKISSGVRKNNIISIEANKDKKIRDFEDLQIKNADLNQREFKSGKLILNSFPQQLGIGAHFSCNAKCKFCPPEDFPYFNFNIYKNFIERRLNYVFPYVGCINLCGYGELLLMPEIEKFLSYLNKTLPDKKKIITTNGIPLNEGVCKLLSEGKYSIQISLHASCSKLHKYITQTDSFDKIMENIRNLIGLSRKNKNLDIYLKSTLTTLNIEDLPSLVKLAVQLGVDGLDCNYMTIYNNAHLKLSCFFQQQLTNNMFDKAEQIGSNSGLSLNLPPRFRQEGYKDDNRCSDPWKYFYVETQGSVTPCCYASEHIGYLNRDEFEDIWNGIGYQTLRRNLVNNGRSGWCQFCYKNNSGNVNDIRSHISFRPGIQEKILTIHE